MLPTQLGLSKKQERITAKNVTLKSFLSTEWLRLQPLVHFQSDCRYNLKQILMLFLSLIYVPLNIFSCLTCSYIFCLKLCCTSFVIAAIVCCCLLKVEIRYAYILPSSYPICGIILCLLFVIDGCISESCFMLFVIYAFGACCTSSLVNFSEFYFHFMLNGLVYGFC